MLNKKAQVALLVVFGLAVILGAFFYFQAVALKDLQGINQMPKEIISAYSNTELAYDFAKESVIVLFDEMLYENKLLSSEFNCDTENGFIIKKPDVLGRVNCNLLTENYDEPSFAQHLKNKIKSSKDKN